MAKTFSWPTKCSAMDVGAKYVTRRLRESFQVNYLVFVQILIFQVLGHGAPVDAIDQLCKAWNQCRSCTTIDSTDGSCDPNDVTYEVGSDPTTNRIDCQFNDNDCAIRNCKCDENLANALTQAFDSLSLNFVTNSDGSGFDHVNECKAVTPNPDNNNNGSSNSNQGPGEVQCCGTYPNRFTFNTRNTRSCCGDVTYNTYNHECCNNSFLAATGECN